MVSGVGATQTYQKTVLIIDRTDATNSYLVNPKTRRFAFAEEVDLNSKASSGGGGDFPQRPLDLLNNAFCSSGQHVGGGDFLSIGGDNSGGGYTPQRKLRGLTWNVSSGTGQGLLRRQLGIAGTFSVRRFKPCKATECGFEMADTLVDKRWYPATQLLGDGRLVMVGGSKQGTGINNGGINTPTLEYFPRGPGGRRSYKVQFLSDSLPFNLYPWVHLLPNGNVFIFSKDTYILWDTDANLLVKAVTPKLNATRGRDGIRSQYPLSGTSVLFPLTPEKDHQAEIMICGGAPQNSQGTTRVLAENRCWRIVPLDKEPKWREEIMRSPRVMPLSTLLPDGNVLIHGGAQYGYCSTESRSARLPAQEPEMFNTKTMMWTQGSLGSSKVPRLYHASGFLLHDGTVWYSGTNPNVGIKRDLSKGSIWTEFRTEFFEPPYMRTKTSAPTVTGVPADIEIGKTMSASFEVSWTFQEVRVVLAQPGFSTHSSNHGMRNVELKVLQTTSSGSTTSVQFNGPPSANIAPKTWYWFFVLVDGVPNRDGKYVFVA